jgi:hypothetical protein
MGFEGHEKEAERAQAFECSAQAPSRSEEESHPPSHEKISVLVTEVFSLAHGICHPT